MNDSKRVWVWVGVVVVVLLIVIAVVWRPSSKPPVATGPVPVYATKGQLIPQFPSSLILGSSTAVNNSYSINYSSSTNQYSAEFTSPSSMANMYALYNKSLPTNGWTIIGSNVTHPTVREISASQAGGQAEILISQVGNGSQVEISYVTN